MRKAHPRYQFAVEIIKTQGDREQNVDLAVIGGQGVFVKELEERLLDHSIDLAVHSLKDMPSQIQAGLKLGAITAREDVRDAFISRSGATLSQMPPGARIGTGSPRRTVQLKLVRPDLKAAPMRGNVDTRIRKLHSGDADALIMASAGLHRMGLGGIITEHLSTDDFLPMVGQAALAVEIREGEEELEELLAVLEDTPTRQAITAERAFLAGLGGGCQAPIAANAIVNGPNLRIEGMVAAPDGSVVLRDCRQCPASSPADAGYLLAAWLIGKGASRFLA